MDKYYKEKIEASILVLFTFIFFTCFFWNLLQSNYELLPISLAFVLFLLFLFIIIWVWDFLNKKLTDILARLLTILYVMLSLVIVFFFSNGIYKIYQSQIYSYSNYIKDNPEGYGFLLYVTYFLLLFLVFLFSYIEPLWRFNKKSLSRKYANGLYYFFSYIYLSTLVEVLDTRRAVSIGMGLVLGGALIFYFRLALFFYLISIIIAAVEYIIKRKYKIVSDAAKLSNEK